jgi:hypothetical protein
MERQGAHAVNSLSANEVGITKLHLSADINNLAAEDISLKLSQRFMDAESYFNLKSFTYYPRNYTLKDFSEDVRLSDHSRLPFRMPQNVGETDVESGKFNKI